MKIVPGLVLLAALSASAAFGQTAPISPPASAPAPAATAPASPACAAAGTWDGRYPSSLARTLIPGTLVVPQGDEVSLELLSPIPPKADPADYAFRVFVFDADAPAGATAKAIEAVSMSHPSANTSAALHIIEPQDAYEIHARVAPEADWAPWSTKRVVAVSCRNGQLVSAAEKTVALSRPIPAKILSIAIMAAAYLLAGTMVWSARRRAIQRANSESLKIVDPKRVIALKPWSWWRCLNPVVMTSDEFDRGSLSNLQILFFVGLVGYGLTNLALRTGALSNLSPAIVYLLGIPAVGSLGNGLAKVTRDRFSTNNWAWLVNRGVLPINDLGKDVGKGAGPKWSDLIMNDTVLDLPKLQALVFSVIVGVAMLATGFRDFANFDVPTSLLEILGLSQAVFVGGRFTQPKTVGDIDDAITELRARAAQLKQAASTGKDVDTNGKPLPVADGAPAFVGTRFASLQSAAAPGAVPTAAQRYKDQEEEVVVLLDALTHRSVATEKLTDPLTWK